MLQVITQSGAVVVGENSTPEQVTALDAAVNLLGGVLVAMPVDENQHVVLAIMEQNVVGTMLVDEDGTEYTLWNSGWVDQTGNSVVTPPYETIIAATMPGGWSWAA